MASQLHEAVRLAQEGRRDEARMLLRQVVQGDPNNEMAWLWLASVAADQAEYERALNEVLRINPTNDQARRLRDQFIQQYGSRLSATPPPQAPAQAPPQTPPPTGQPYYGTPPGQQPPPSYYSAPAQPPRSEPGYAPYGAPVQESVVRHERVVERRGRRGCFGCGCVPSCLLALLVIVVLPAVICGGLALAVRDRNLGPVDLVAGYLPDDLGRKDIEFEVDNRPVSVKVPRSWYLVAQDNELWTNWSDVLERVIPFDDAQRTWADEAVNLATVTLQNANVPILEMNPYHLMQGGAPSGLLFQGLTTADELGIDSFDCDTVNGSEAEATQDYSADEGPTFSVIPRGEWCGYRVDAVMQMPADRIFSGYDAPVELHQTEFYVPLDANSASAWSVSVPEDQYTMYAGDIEQMVETATVGAGSAGGTGGAGETVG